MVGHFMTFLLAFVPHFHPTQCTVFRRKEKEKNMYCLSLKFAVFWTVFSNDCNLPEIIDGNNNEVGVN